MSAPQLSVSEAKTLINAWKDMTAAEKGLAIDSLKSWRIPHDAVDALFTDNAYSIRTYLGFDSSNSEVKLIVVGTTDEVNGTYEDVIGQSPNTKIYDYTEPCPTNCDTNSPLY